jgi:hypothetical protein
MSSQPKSGNSGTQKQQDDLADMVSGETSLETVRDILFGKQLRETQNRGRELEKLIKSSVNELDKKIQSQFKEMNKALEKLRSDVEKAAGKTAKQVAGEFEETRASISDLETATKASQAELYDTLDTARLALEKDAKAWNEKLGDELDTVHARLQDAKIDRLALANLFNHVALELAGTDEDK